MKKITQAGFAPVVGLIAIIALVVGLTAAVLVVRNQVGLNTKASGFGTTKVTGKFIKDKECFTSFGCYKINNTSVISIGNKINLETYLNKTVTAEGILQTVKGVSMLSVSSITIGGGTPTATPSATPRVTPTVTPIATPSATPANGRITVTGKISKSTSYKGFTYVLTATDKKVYLIFPSTYDKVIKYDGQNVRVTGQLINSTAISALLGDINLLAVETVIKI